MTPSGDLSGRVALVTGGGRGVGRAVSLALAAKGATVVVNYHRDEASATRTVNDIRALGASAVAFCASVTSHTACEAMVESIVAEMGPISILINNSGVATRAAKVVNCDPAEVLDAFEVHALGSFRLCQLVIPHMRETPRGDVIMISSTATTNWNPGAGAYNMAKAAMEALAYTLSREESSKNIRVNVVAPGLVATDMGRRLVRSYTGGREIHELDAQAPFGHVCRPEEVASVVTFLASSGGSYITGQRIRVDGGNPGAIGMPAGRGAASRVEAV